MGCAGQVPREPLWSATTRRRNKHLGRSQRIDPKRALCSDPVRNPVSVWRESRSKPFWPDELRLAAKDGHDVDAPALPARSKNNAAAVGRKIRFGFVGVPSGQPNGLAAPQMLHPDV